MILGIDASNIRGGGGVTHLVELLAFSDPAAAGFERVLVWGSAQTLSELPTRKWLEPVHVRQLDLSLFSRIRWQQRKLPGIAEQTCDVLFVPGGSFTRCPIPVVTMSQNLLPFEIKEVLRYGCSWVLIRLLLLRIAQGSSFSKADGVIFLTKYAKEKVISVVGELKGRHTIIPHGISKRFYSFPKRQLGIKKYSLDKPFRFLYVSIIDMYKHQWHVVEAFSRLRREGIPVELDLIGPYYGPAYRRLRKALNLFDRDGSFIRYLGRVPYEELEGYTSGADGVVFASTCENLPIILLEAMASGLPIVCSSYGPMPDVLRDAGVYFDPECVDSLCQALHEMLSDELLREKMASRAYKYALEFSWERCAKDTFEFLASVGK